jgi:hypothetical protein
MHYAKLSFKVAEREGVTYTPHLFKKAEAVRTVSTFIDIYVDDTSLLDILNIMEASVITPYFTGSKSNFLSILKGLVVENDLPSGIIPVYVCAECGDYGCGVFGWKIDIRDKDVRWYGFQWDDNLGDELESDISDDRTSTTELYFDKIQYFEALNRITEIEETYNLQ